MRPARMWPAGRCGQAPGCASMWAVSRASLVAMLTAVAALAVYVLPGLPDPVAHWPLWDARVYEWGGRQAAAGGGVLYVPGARFSFTYPPFAAVLFAGFSGVPAWALKAALTAGSLVALPVLCGQALDAAEAKRRPEIVFAVSALALQTWPVAYTLHLGEINLILAALIGTDLLRREDRAWWQGAGTGLTAGVKLTPLIFVAYLALTGRLRAAGVAVAAFALTVAAGFAWLPGRSRTFWLGGCSTTSAGWTTRPTRRTSRWPGRWPGWPAPGTRRASGGWRPAWRAWPWPYGRTVADTGWPGSCAAPSPACWSRRSR